MDLQNMDLKGGSLQISTEVIAKIARLAAMEIDGVKEVCTTSGMKSILGRPKNVAVDLLDDVAEITLHLVVYYGAKIPPVCEKVQENVKAAVQNMTQITVSRVNVVVVGVQVKAEPAEME